MTSVSANGGADVTKTVPGGGGNAQAAKNSSEPPISVNTLPPTGFITLSLPNDGTRPINEAAAWCPGNDLLPASVHPVPAVRVMVDPVPSHPYGVWPRRDHVVALDPDVCAAVPAVIAGDPNVVGRRSHRNCL